MILRRFWLYASRHRASIVIASLMAVANKFFDILPEVLIGVAVDVVVNRETSFLAKIGISSVFYQLVALGFLTLIIWSLESLFQYWYQVRFRMLAQAIQHELRLDAFAHVSRLGMAYFENRSSGNLIAILNDDVNQLERFLDHEAPKMIQIFAGSIMVGAIFFYLAPQIAFAALLPIPLILLGAFYFRNRLETLYQAVRDRAGLISARLANSLLGMPTIQSFTNEAYELDRLRQESNNYMQANNAAIHVSSAFIPIIRMAIMMGFIVTVVYGGQLAVSGQLAVGGYSVLVFLTQRLLWPFTELASIIDSYQRAAASAKRVFDVLDTPLDVAHGYLHLAKSAVKGSIRFDNVTFRYESSGVVLRDINLDIKPANTIAFVGSTGAGKSTIMKLLLRFYEPSSGTIWLDGIDITTIKMHDFRQLIGFVSQDVFLFHGTILENIAYGNLHASQDEVVAAAKSAEAHSFIEDLPAGYHTVVGERGQKLSGGQRQRLSIARAILKRPPIYLLDEATSSVDNETEEAIKRSIDLIAKDHTTVIIAHRLSTIRHADTIVVMDHGAIVEQGKHEELLALGGTYRRLWDIQTGV